MTSVILPDEHAHLIDLQIAVFDATAELYGHAPDVSGRDMTEEQAARAVELRAAARDAAEAKDAALHASGLVATHGYYTADQDLKATTRAHQRAQAETEPESAG